MYRVTMSLSSTQGAGTTQMMPTGGMMLPHPDATKLLGKWRVSGGVQVYRAHHITTQHITTQTQVRLCSWEWYLRVVKA